MSSKTAESMTWHHDQRTDNGLLRHPADSLAWKPFDNKFPSFASDPQSVRLGLASDGFNPYKIMSTSHLLMLERQCLQGRAKKKYSGDPNHGSMCKERIGVIKGFEITETSI
ncbi:hypothetical protein J1N35_025621 [Gossypium stocksii]|uniref:Uncharacterized protein n=1 Tax=Gossypium stocksii TaxID=47602 RepID=A0A9D3ZYF8_9ROSI|nr:hypothetical protein J1N35_025621 [Gossypium stocksii]